MNGMTKAQILGEIDLMVQRLGILRNRVETGELEQTGEITCAILENADRLEAEFLG